MHYNCITVVLQNQYYLGPCHGYLQQRGRTGGWQDCHCPHLFKLCSKMESIQESVADPSDIMHSFKKRPICLVCDDACTLVEYELAHYPDDSERCLGTRKGCFEEPSELCKPTDKIDCKVCNKSENCSFVLIVWFVMIANVLTYVAKGSLRINNMQYCQAQPKLQLQLGWVSYILDFPHPLNPTPGQVPIGPNWGSLA